MFVNYTTFYTVRVVQIHLDVRKIFYIYRNIDRIIDTNLLATSIF